MNISEAGFGSSGAGSSAFDKGLVQKNITEYQRKIMEMTDQLAMLRAEQDLKERADKLQNAIQQMITGSRYLSYSKIKEVV
jgi:mannitol-specific phosphotransferase system IIBC component